MASCVRESLTVLSSSETYKNTQIIQLVCSLSCSINSVRNQQETITNRGNSMPRTKHASESIPESGVPPASRIPLGSSLGVPSEDTGITGDELTTGCSGNSAQESLGQSASTSLESRLPTSAVQTAPSSKPVDTGEFRDIPGQVKVDFDEQGRGRVMLAGGVVGRGLGYWW